MVLDTRSKSIKDSFVAKTALILLSVIMCIIAVLNAVPLFDAGFSLREKMFSAERSITDDYNFMNQYDNCASNIVNSANQNAFDKIFEQQKKNILETSKKDFDSAVAEYNAHKDYYNRLLAADNTEEDFDEEESEISTTLYSYEAELNLLQKQKHIRIDTNTGTIYFSARYEIDVLSNGHEIYIEKPLYSTYENIEKTIVNELNVYYNDCALDYKNDLSGIKNMKYYIVAVDNTVITNIENPEGFISGIEKNKLYLHCEKGKKVSGNLSDYMFDSVNQAYVAMTDNFSEDDNFNKIYIRYSNLKSSEQLSNCIIKFAIAIIILIILMVLSTTFAGHKNATVSTAAIDKVPNLLHFVLSFGLATLCGCGAAFAYEGLWYLNSELYSFDCEKALKFAIFAAISGAYLFIIEWITSLARQIKTGTNVFKNTFIYKIFVFIFRNIKNAFVSIKNFLSYKPQNFKKHIAILVSGFGILNLFFLIMQNIWACQVCDDSNYAVLAIFNALLWTGMDVTAIVFAVKYIINLDRIITSAHNRTSAPVNYEKLPASLKTLVDALRISNDELNSAVQKAVKDERMRTELITNVSHDLKTPLTSIISYVDLLKQLGIQDEQAREYIDVLDEKGARLKRLIDDLIEASKVTSGVITINAVNINLAELATQAIVEHQQEFSENGLELIFKNDKNSLMAFADGTKTFRVMENLLSNARKYSAKGSRVYADVYSANNTAVFELKNISSEPLDITADELKERFVRGDKSRNNEGNGLGLSIADSLCKAMNGRLDLSIDGDLFKAKIILPNEK